MENQINIDDQNAQQVGQNLVNQPVQIPSKPKVNYWMYLTIALTIMVVLGAIYTINLKRQLDLSYSLISQQNSQQKSPVVPATTFIPTASPTLANPTSKWTTYKSVQGYEIKYPNDWFVLEGMVTRFSNKKDDSQKDGLIVVSVFTNSDVNMDSMKSRKKIYEEKPDEFKILRDTVIDGKPAFEFDFLQRPQREIVIAGDLEEVPQSLYTIFVYYDSTKKNEAIDIYSQMVSTFKFTK